ncbi:MAG: 3-hydroxyacyl-CoA dehydrogenase family protein [Candidatus Bathyarchaeota archaeon]|nr:MAG: 3-hydroxyacyl-CoA dehydrogenase family protein [Candidatus Bathyarchaeota archaeon]
MRPIEKVSIIGAGFMGSQIGLQCASHGLDVRLYDVSDQALGEAVRFIEGELEERMKGGQITDEDEKAILGRISLAGDLAEAVSDADLVIEAVPERLEVKREVFRMLDEACPERTIIATNSSSIRVSKIEDATNRLDRVLNAHFYSHLSRRRIVELMRGSSTSDETMERVRMFMRSIGMTPLTVLKESTGFIFNRVWRAIKRECLHLVDQGVASFEDVDRAWMSLYGTPAGPFGMMDWVGLDVVRDIEMVYYKESGDERDAPPRVLLEKIERGKLGIKTGKGFYTYPDPAFEDPDWLYGDQSG